jgi:hypothetical protein
MLSVKNRRKVAAELYRNKLCPRCKQPISLFEAFCIIFGNGWDNGIIVEFDSGGRGVISSSDYDPQRMTLMEKT